MKGRIKTIRPSGFVVAGIYAKVIISNTATSTLVGIDQYHDSGMVELSERGESQIYMDGSLLE